MDDVQGLFLGMPHGTTPAAVTTNKKIIMSSFKSNGDSPTVNCNLSMNFVLLDSVKFKSRKNSILLHKITTCHVGLSVKICFFTSMNCNCPLRWVYG